MDLPATIGPKRRPDRGGAAEGSTTPSRRPELLSMADDYARHALSQRAAFEATHPAVMAAAERLASEPVLYVADLGAADGVNSHGLIRDLVAQRAGRPLIYALVDLPTNAWRVAAAHLRDAFGPADGPGRDGRDPRAGRVRPRRRRHGHGRPLRLAGGPRRGLSASARSRPASRRGRLHGRNPTPPGALPSARHSAPRGDRDDHALGRRRRRPGLERLGLPRLPGPRGRGRATRLARRRGAAVGANARDARSSSWRRGAGLSPPSRPPPLHARTGRGSTSRSSGT